MRLSAKPYQSDIASAVQAIADRKNSLGLGKNETNMVGGFPLRSKELPTPLQDTGEVAKGRNAICASRGQTCYSITSSARPSSVSGTVMPSAFAALRLMSNSSSGAC